MKRTLLIILIAALLLSAASFGLKDITASNRQKEHVWLMQALLPNSEDFVRVPYNQDGTLIKSVHKSDVGFVIETVTNGYADEICMLIGVNNDGKVMGLVVLDAHETPGLGSKILYDHEFLSQFLNKNGSFAIDTQAPDAFSHASSIVESTENEIYVDGISGATVSSKAVAKSVNAAIAYVMGNDAVSSATTWGG